MVHRFVFNNILCANRHQSSRRQKTGGYAKVFMNTTRIFKTRHFARWLRKTDISDALLYAAVCEMKNGLIDADLGGGLVKKRIALVGRGKRRSLRTLLATNKNDLWFFVFGFEKNERTNVNTTELKALHMLAADLLKLSSQELNIALENNTLQEMHHDH